jgi:hypothetical protein
MMPWDIDACPDRGLVGSVHFLNLHCSDEIREQRWRERPPWRQCSHPNSLNLSGLTQLSHAIANPN